jgi:hypothetical protein
MRKTTLCLAIFGLAICGVLNTGCKSTATPKSGDSSTKTADSKESVKPAKAVPPKADFTMSAIEYHMEFDRATLPEELKQYANKNIALSGIIQVEYWARAEAISHTLCSSRWALMWVPPVILTTTTSSK